MAAARVSAAAGRDAEGATRPETLRHPYGSVSRTLESGHPRDGWPTEGVRRRVIGA